MWKSIIELNRLRLWLPLELSFFLLSKYIFCESRLRRNMKKRRRENTIDIMHAWCSALEKNTSLAVDIAQQLSPPQCKVLYDKQSFESTHDVKNDIFRFCEFEQKGKDQPCHNCSLCESNENGQWIVDGRILREL